MTIFDLFFLLAALVSIITLLTALAFAVSGRGTRAVRLLRNFGITAAVYLVIGVLVSGLRPQRVIAPGQPWCFDDWCLELRAIDAANSADTSIYTAHLTIESRALRISQRARGAWLYLVDDKWRRFAPESDSASRAVPLDVLLGPGQSVTTSRTFRVPADAHPVGLVTGHGGPYCGVMNFVVIGEAGCLFHKPAMIRVP